MTVIQNNVIEIQEGGVLAGVRRQAKSIQSNLVQNEPSGSTAQLRQAQKKGQADIFGQLAAIGDALTAAVDEIASGALDVPTFRQLSTTEAVITYWRSHVPAWAAAVGIDLLPLILLLAMMGIVEQQRDMELRDNRLSAATQSAGVGLRNHAATEAKPSMKNETVAAMAPSEPTDPINPAMEGRVPTSPHEVQELAHRALEEHNHGIWKRKQS